MRQWGDRLELVVIVDGSVTEAMRRQFQRCFPGGTLAEAREYLGDFAKTSPALEAFIRENYYGRKFGVLLKMNQEHPVLYSDNDVLVWDWPRELAEAMEEGGSVYYNSSPDSPFAPSVVERFRARGLELPGDFNAGILYLPQGRLDLTLTLELLREIPSGDRHHFIEQALLAGLSARGRLQALSEERYCLSMQGMWPGQGDIASYEGLVARHYTGPVRHWMYLKGYPRLRDAVRRDQAGSSSTSPR